MLTRNANRGRIAPVMTLKQEMALLGQLAGRNEHEIAADLKTTLGAVRNLLVKAKAHFSPEQQARYETMLPGDTPLPLSTVRTARERRHEQEILMAALYAAGPAAA